MINELKSMLKFDQQVQMYQPSVTPTNFGILFDGQKLSNKLVTL